MSRHLVDLLLADTDGHVCRLRHPPLPLFHVAEALHVLHDLAANVLFECFQGLRLDLDLRLLDVGHGADRLVLLGRLVVEQRSNHLLRLTIETYD